MVLSVFLVLTISLNCFVSARTVSRSVKSFIDHEIVPDLLETPPDALLSVTFPNGIQALEGNELTPSQVTGVPDLRWIADTDRYYTLIFCDADAPSRVNPEARSFLHWLVVNIPGADVTAGHTLTSILNSHPEPETGFHRYIFLVYEQPAFIEFEEQPDDSFERRKNFAPEHFSKNYSLGSPVAGNFYQTANLDN